MFFNVDQIKRKTLYFRDKGLHASCSLIRKHLEYGKFRGFNVALLCDNESSLEVGNTMVSRGFASTDTLFVVKGGHVPETDPIYHWDFNCDWHLDIDSLVIPRVRERDPKAYYDYYREFKSRVADVSLFDQVIPGGYLKENSQETYYQYRELKFVITPTTVIPSYYSNSQYIDILKQSISKHRDAKIMEMCAGQGAIGLSLFNELENISHLTLVDINDESIKSINKTIELNNLDSTKIEVLSSNIFSNVDESKEFDFIIANPPHQDAGNSSQSLVDMQGNDFGWKFHYEFLSNAHRYLCDGGTVSLNENGKPEYSSEEIFKDIVDGSTSEMYFDRSYWINGTHWYVVEFRK